MHGDNPAWVMARVYVIRIWAKYKQPTLHIGVLPVKFTQRQVKKFLRSAFAMEKCQGVGGPPRKI